MMKVSAKASDLKALRADVKALKERFEGLVGESRGMNVFEIGAYNQVVDSFFNASHAIHMFWTAADHAERCVELPVENSPLLGGDHGD